MNNLTAVGAYLSAFQKSFATINQVIKDLQTRVNTLEVSVATQPQAVATTTPETSPSVDLTPLTTDVQRLTAQLAELTVSVQELNSSIEQRVDQHIKSSLEVDEKIKAAITLVLEGLTAATSVVAEEASVPQVLEEDIILAPVTEPTPTPVAPVKKITRKKQ